ncbi:hypothetical protein PILCRDRAFT_547935 [Piloderma croceum F 1598]|uniref:Uncharacterized protein n=1 Tax=Piloderma croceum (strain F 1598) TaxID=765440 RepID=A0A0C3B0Y4_PILCF|nr:hypothetical protein PILCRDRAFT_547935 [Piloderma croceum F 1598]
MVMEQRHEALQELMSTEPRDDGFGSQRTQDHSSLVANRLPSLRTSQASAGAFCCASEDNPLPYDPEIHTQSTASHREDASFGLSHPLLLFRV